MRFLAIKGSSEYGVLRSFVDHIVPAFANCGHEVIVYDTVTRFNSSSTPPQIRGNIDAIITFNSMGTDVNDTNGKNLFEEMGIPVIAWLVDHPAYHYSRLNNPISKKINLVASEVHNRYIRDAGITGENRVLLAAALETKTRPKEFSKRHHQTVFAATFMGEPMPFWREQFDDAAARIIEEAMDILVSDPFASPYDALVYAYAQAGIAIKPGPIVSDIINLMLTFLRARDRIETMHALAASGLPVTIIGEGWESYLNNHGALSFIPRLSVEDLLDLYADAQVVMNFNAANGACERAFSGMLAGAAVLSDLNQTLAEITDPGQDIMFYNRATPGDLIETLRSLTESPLGREIAMQGQISAMNKHRWIHRIQQLNVWLQTKDSFSSPLEEVA